MTVFVYVFVYVLVLVLVYSVVLTKGVYDADSRETEMLGRFKSSNKQ
jgi:uncharacterized membrane protein